MESFPSAKHLCSWAGLTPTNNESAGKKKSVRVSKAGCYIKPLLVQCATAVVKSEKHPEIRNRYLQLKKRRGHKKAIIAIARMLLTALYNMLKKNEPYNAELYRNSDVIPANREITVEQSIQLENSKVTELSQLLNNLSFVYIQFFLKPPEDGLFAMPLRKVPIASFLFQP
jgi:hypothetical protein